MTTDSRKAGSSLEVPRLKDSTPDNATALEKAVAGLFRKEAALDLSSKPSVANADRVPGKPMTETGPDGSKSSYDWVQKDGKLTARLLHYEKDGVSRDFKYDNAADPLKVTEYTDRTKAYYEGGKELVTTAKREGDTNTFKVTDSNGRTEIHDNVRFENGQVKYELRPQDMLAWTMDQIFGKDTLIAGDLQGAMDNLVEKAGNRLFGGHLRSHLENIVKRFDEQEKKGIRRPTDDQIAAIFRSAARVMETSQSDRKGSAGQLSDTKVARAAQEFLTGMEDLKKGLYQGQIGSCLLHSLICFEAVGFPHKLAAMFEDAYTRANS